MKKFLCVLLSFVIFVTMSFFMVVPCFAVASFVADYSATTILDYGKSIYNQLNDSLARKTEAARSFYFSHIVDSVYSNGITIFDDSGTRFTDEILEYHFEQYYSSAYYMNIYDSNGDIFMSSAGFPGTPWSLRLLRFVPYLGSTPVKDDDITKNNAKTSFKNYYQTYLARYLLAQGGTATDPNPGKTGLEIAPGYVNGSELKEAVEQDNNKYYPKNFVGKVSYRSDKIYQATFSNSRPNYFYMPLIEGNRYFTVTGSPEMYLVFFFKTDTDDYYSAYQLHLTLDVVENWFEDRDEIESYSITLKIEYWDMVDGSPEEKSTMSFDITNFSYVRFGLDTYKTLRLFCSSTYSNYIKFSVNQQNSSGSSLNASNMLFYLSDLSSSLPLSSLLHCGNIYATHDASCEYGGKCDIGYVASATPISTVYNVDTTKIPDDAVITVGGDNIYNYYITNPETGDTSKFGDYITNNYTYITNNNGGQSGGSGSVGGNVEVGGKIEVGGSVGVDVNVNVNGNGGGAGVTPNPEDFLGDSEVDLTSYYDKAVEDASGVRKFLGVFFDFLPTELLGLLCLLVVVAICCRIFGR